MCTNMGAGARRAAAPAAPAAQAAAPAAAPAAAQQATGRLVSDTGIQDMDDATLTALIMRAHQAPMPTDGRDRTSAQMIADALGITKNVPESVPQEALAQYRGQSGANGLMYRTVNDQYDNDTGALIKTSRQIAHELTNHTDNYGWNYGGGRAYGTGLYFAAQGSRSTPGESAAHSAQAYGGRNPYTIEARLKPTARIATDATFRSTAAKQWALAHKTALSKVAVNVDSRGNISTRGRDSDMRTTVAMLMGYDGYREDSSTSVYHTIFNLAALQVARGNKYDRAYRGQLTR